MKQPHAVAGIVDAHLVRELGGEFVHADDVVEELADFEDMGGDALMLGAMEQVGVFVFDENDTRGRGTDHIVVFFEEALHVFGQWFRIVLETAVGLRLSAACLRHGIVHIEAQRAEEFKACHPHLRVAGVDVTWYE